MGLLQQTETSHIRCDKPNPRGIKLADGSTCEYLFIVFIVCVYQSERD